MGMEDLRGKPEEPFLFQRTSARVLELAKLLSSWRNRLSWHLSCKVSPSKGARVGSAEHLSVR